MIAKKLAYGSILAGFISANALADEHAIKAVITNWMPLVTYIKPGDTIKFVQMAGHDTETIEGMFPKGAKPWKAKLGEEAFSVKLEKEGAYIYKCNPHMTTGMVGAVVVGEGVPKNLATLEGSLNKVKVGKNMVNRTIRKLKEDLKKTGRMK